MNCISSFWSGKTVFVAGATGFFGGWLVRRLLHCGANVVTLVHSYKPDSQFYLESFNDSTFVHWVDVADQALIEEIFDRHPIEVFFHAAYGADVHHVLDEPLDCFSSALSTAILDFQEESSELHIQLVD
jgi:CDP-glucose 4,6-dehydratase